MRRVHIIVHGQVQGVNFRRHTAQKAKELGVHGYVRNLPDNAVEVVAEGNAEKVEELIAFCRRGPSMAVVTEVIVEEEKPKRDMQAFEVRR